ncbi:flagellar export protein FliJ [Dyella caseinilytica]|uniref:Flagellar FliJ protein n=1 Tax=Dyella caseinilytica TaxID=1849581 RepID=A0ABX7GSW7_9GAMM|nr:flagellar export protein FliJ [Dyella caseinilytica]QRN53399.1 flagellar export protein FliJ [Dyella caseinilytica]GFZ86216.1 flagellar export protein FliJ [Dyella caseinilytica]
MTSRSDRLQPAVDQAQRRQKDALQRLAEQQQKLAHAEQQLEELKRYRRDYSLGDGGLTVSALLNRQQFVERIDQAIVQQGHLLERLQRQLESARQRWLQAHARENALDNVVERFRAQEQQSEQRQEQAEVDERMQYRNRRIRTP